jgi:hypothetical protein
MFTTLSRGLAQASRGAMQPFGCAASKDFARFFHAARPATRALPALSAYVPPVGPAALPGVNNADARSVSTLSWKFRPYAMSTAPLTGLVPLSTGYTAVGLTLVAAPQQVLLTSAGVLGMLGIANLVHGAINRGAMFQHNWLMVFFQMVIAFMPVPCFENLFTDLVFVAMFLVGTVFTLNMLPEVLLKDFFFINFFVFFMMPLLPLAFSMMPLFNARSYLFL